MPSQHEQDQSFDSDLFEGVDYHAVSHLTRAFDIMAERLGPLSNSTALCALATLLAKIMAAASLDEELMKATGQRFSDMLRAQYPAMVQAMEKHQRETDGRPRYDA